MPATNSKNGAWAKRWRAAFLVLQRNRLVVLALCCLSAVWWADVPSISGAFVFIVSVVLAASIFRWRFVFFVALAILCATMHHRRVVRESNLHEALLQKSSVEGVFYIQTPPRKSSQTWSAFAFVDGKKFEVQGRNPAPSMGTALYGKGFVEPWRKPRNEGEFDHPNWLRRKGVVATIRLQQVVEDPSQTHKLLQWLDGMRLKLRHSITSGLAPESNEAKVILAMVIGEQPGQDDEILSAFRLSGTLHLFSVSGQHVNLVAIILWLVLRILRVPRRYAIGLLIPSIFLYAYVTGASPPAIRAAWMATVFLAAFWFQRKPNLLAALSIVMLFALFLDSHLIFLAGVQLSYGVVAAISIGLSLCNHRIQRWSLMDDYLPRELYTSWQERWVSFKRGTAQSLAASSSACLGSAPLSILHFGMITPISVLANLLMTPFVGMILGLALLSVTLNPIFPSAVMVINRLNGLVARICIGISEVCADIPGAHRQYSFNQPPHDTIRIFDLPRGGAATMLQLKNADLLLDTGSIRDKKTLIASLAYFGCSPDCFLLSHAEAGHVGSAENLLSKLPVQQIISPVAESRAASFRRLVSAANSRQVPLLLAQPTVLSLSDQVKCRFIPTPGCSDKRLIADDRVCLHLLDFHGFTILFAHDASPSDLRDLWPTFSPPIDVLVLGRHELFSWPIDSWPVNPPRVVIASHADFPSSERLPVAWSQQLESQGIHVLSQNDTGMVSIHVNQQSELCLRGFLAKEWKLSRRLHD
jgi:ComEC/Rec2-related protein